MTTTWTVRDRTGRPCQATMATRRWRLDESWCLLISMPSGSKCHARIASCSSGRLPKFCNAKPGGSCVANPCRTLSPHAVETRAHECLDSASDPKQNSPEPTVPSPAEPIRNTNVLATSEGALPMPEDSNVAVILASIIVMTATVALLQISGTIHLPGL
jgi:hypothetical protein